MEYVKILSEDTEDVKKIKSTFNSAFDSFDENIKKNLSEVLEKINKSIDEKSAGTTTSFELALKKFSEDAEANQKSQADQIEELRKALTELNRVTVIEKEQKIASLRDNIWATLHEHENELKNWNTSKSNKAFNLKAVTTISVPTNGVAPEFNPIVGIPHELVHARNVIPVSPTNSDKIRYIQMTVKEGAIAGVAEGGAKPAFDYTPTVKTADVQKIAGNITVTDEFLEDVVGSRDFLASELPQAWLDVEDQQIFKGSGTGENIQGLMTVAPGLYLPKGDVNNGSNDWDKLAAASTQIRVAKRAATAAFISPVNYLNLLINKGNTNEYTYPVQAGTGGTLMLGDIPIYQHTVFAENEGLIGDFTRGTRIFQKMAPVVKFSTEHANNFTSNLTTIVVEGRIALPIYYPDGFVNINFNYSYAS